MSKIFDSYKYLSNPTVMRQNEPNKPNKRSLYNTNATFIPYFFLALAYFYLSPTKFISHPKTSPKNSYILLNPVKFIKCINCENWSLIIFFLLLFKLIVK